MSRLIRNILGLVAVVVTLTACTTPLPKLTPKGKVDVPFEADNPRVTVSVQLANEVLIHLGPVKMPGAQWTMVVNDPRFLQLEHPITSAANGEAVATFLAVRTGRRLLRFITALPAERESISTQSYDVVVTIE